MALGDPVLVNLSGATFTLTAETGAIIQSTERSVDSKLKEVFNAAVGYTVGYVFYDFAARQDYNAIVNNNTGVSAAQVGVALSLANNLGLATTNMHGVSAGGAYVTSVRVSHQGEDLRMISGSTVQRQNIS